VKRPSVGFLLGLKVGIMRISFSFFLFLFFPVIPGDDTLDAQWVSWKGKKKFNGHWALQKWKTLSPFSMNNFSIILLK
jgi:hypothetical protein